MKYYLYILFAITIFSCVDTDKEKRVVVILDITDKFHAIDLINVETIANESMRALDIDENYYGSAEIYIHTLDELSGGKARTISLKSDSRANEQVRGKDIDKFQNRLEEVITDVVNVKKEKDQSKIYSKLCDILNDGKNTARTVLIYSDLLENSPMASFYDMETLNSAAAQPDSFVDKHLEEYCTMGSLHKISVYIFPLRVPANDELVNRAEVFWKKLFENKGASVKINREPY